MRSKVKAIETPWLASRWEPVGTVELTETSEPARDITFFPDPLGHSYADATMPAPTSLPSDAQRQRECEAAAEGWV